MYSRGYKLVQMALESRHSIKTQSTLQANDLLLESTNIGQNENPSASAEEIINQPDPEFITLDHTQSCDILVEEKEHILTVIDYADIPENSSILILADGGVQNDLTAQEENQEQRTQGADIFPDVNDNFVDSLQRPNGDISKNNLTSNENNDEKNLNGHRWRKAKPETWSYNINIKKRNECLPYVDKKHKAHPAKSPKSVNCSKCRFECSTNFSDHERETICRKYWGLGSYDRRMDFILMNITITTPKYRRPRKGDNSLFRSNSKSYFFLKDNKRVRVCQNFFMKTLDINNGPINSAFKKKDSHGSFAGRDGRGRKEPGNKTPTDQIREVKRHIESFPTVESHYTRKSTKRLYLESNLSISKMYNLYLEECKKQNSPYVSKITYRRTFCSDYNLSFFKPKKDQCVTCNQYKQARELTDEIKERNNEHLKRVNISLQLKEKDKVKASESSSFVTASFDLQSVLQIPSSDVSLMYYLRKLNFFNFTIYESAPPSKAFCYAWTEIDGKRGSAEIGTCLLKWIKQLPPEVTEISLYSDCCGGQNRNQYIASLFLYVVKNTSVKIVTHNFMESGHSYMEVDSMHSSIESAKKNVPVYTVQDWLTIFRFARSMRNKNKIRGAYTVQQLEYNEFLDLKYLASSIINRNSLKNVNSEGEKVNWLKIKRMRFEADAGSVFKYSYNYEGDYQIINVTYPRKSVQQPLRQLYTNQLPISHQKKKDLLTLCKKNIIPPLFHGWYESLPVCAKTEKSVEPGISDSENDEF